MPEKIIQGEAHGAGQVPCLVETWMQECEGRIKDEKDTQDAEDDEVGRTEERASVKAGALGRGGPEGCATWANHVCF